MRLILLPPGKLDTPSSPTHKCDCRMRTVFSLKRDEIRSTRRGGSRTAPFSPPVECAQEPGLRSFRNDDSGSACPLLNEGFPIPSAGLKPSAKRIKPFGLRWQNIYLVIGAKCSYIKLLLTQINYFF